MKQNYEKPQLRILDLECSPLMLGGSNTVTDYTIDDDIDVGDGD